MTVFSQPSRAVLIVGAVKAALYGMEQRRILELRMAKVQEWSEDAELTEIRRVAETVYSGGETQTRDREIIGMLAYTQQTMRVSHEEWDSVVRVKLDQ